MLHYLKKYSIFSFMYLRILVCLLLSITCYAEENKIAVIDTGLDLNDPRFSGVLCREGHKDFTGEGLKDNIGHGTHVVGIIKKYAGDSNYCLIILKFFDNKKDNGDRTLRNLLKAYLTAKILGVKIINYSGGGYSYSELEKKIIINSKDILFVVAAGNDGKDLSEFPYYPAAYNLINVVSVGNLITEGVKNENSNYGDLVKSWEIGTNVVSTCPNNTYCMLTGTSMSTAVKTGKLINLFFGN